MTDEPTKRVQGTDAELIARALALRDHLANEGKRFEEYARPFKDEEQSIQNELLARFVERGSDNTRTEAGTAYKSTIMNLKVEDRDTYIKFVIENWTDWGSEMLMANAQKDAVFQYMSDHDGKLPPGLTNSYFTRVNIRRS